jgi:hypothetical protein
MITIELPDHYIVDYTKINWNNLFHNFCMMENIRIDSRCACLFNSSHSAASSDRDFCYNTSISRKNGFMLIGASCWHERCKSDINKMLSTLNKKWKKYVDENGDKVKVLQKSSEESIRENKEALARIFAELEHRQWKMKLVGEIKNNIVPITYSISPTFPEPIDDFKFHLGLFQENDVIFMGHFNQPKHLYIISNEGLSGLKHIPEFTSTHTFSDVTKGRNSENCNSKPYGVLELDNGITKEEQLALLLSIEKTLKIKLIMALDSGGKSIHGWFNWIELEKYVDVFNELGYDMKTLKSRSQPVRLAGAFRINKEKYQRIIYVGEK